MRYQTFEKTERVERVRPGFMYQFEKSEWPYKVGSALRFFSRGTILRAQYEDRDAVSFTPDTRVWMVVPTQIENHGTEVHQIQPYLIISDAYTGSECRINFRINVEREIRNHNDAVAYMRRILCEEAIKVTKHDLKNLERFPVRGHYDAAYFEEQITRFQARVDGFLTYNHYPVYD